jgi:glycerol uptake facilitator-like aquaporin
VMKIEKAIVNILAGVIGGILGALILQPLFHVLINKVLALFRIRFKCK